MSFCRSLCLFVSYLFVCMSVCMSMCLFVFMSVSVWLFVYSLYFCINVSLLSRPLLNPIGEIGSGYPTDVDDGNRTSLPILRQKMAQSDV
jgi:hypothetical protein